MSGKKSFKFNKSNNKSQQKTVNQQQYQLKGTIAQKKLSKQASSENQFESGLTVSVHKAWPDLHLNQSRLFFECTLFLYSVLALFLQYLNLYKTLWWLPKSYWQYSLKYHLVNPYLLSCIGLLLGVRVTRCFWDTLGERIDYFSNGKEDWRLTCWKVFEYAIIKTPLTTTVTTSFMFSFTRIYAEFGVKALFYFFSPLFIHIFLFRNEFVRQLFGLFSDIIWPINNLIQTKNRINTWNWKNPFGRLPNLAETFFQDSPALLDLESIVHLCSDMAVRTREEALLLLADFNLRCRHCVFIGILTAYFAIFMPRALLPMKTSSGEPQYMLIDDVWVAQMFLIIALTSLSLYITYLFPINYFDLLYRCVVHLGHWERIEAVQQPQQEVSAPSTSAGPSQQHNRQSRSQLNLTKEKDCLDSYDPSSKSPYNDGTRILWNNGLYIARSHPHFRTVAAEPANEAHARLYRIANDPVSLVTYLCIFQTGLVAFEFWLLLMTTDWQQIVTLVLLMFANYLLLGKMFKDRVIIGRMYNPSSEDEQLIEQLKKEMETKRSQKKLQGQDRQK